MEMSYNGVDQTMHTVIMQFCTCQIPHASREDWFLDINALAMCMIQQKHMDRYTTHLSEGIYDRRLLHTI